MLKTVVLQGTAHEMGLQAGRAFRAAKAAEASRWARWPAEPDRQATYRAIIAQSLAYLRRELPAVVDELQGVAEGAGMTLEDAYMFNAANSVGPALPYAGCTSLAFTHSDVGPILGKTDDGGHPTDAEAALRHRLESVVVTTVRPTEGYALMGVAPLGALWAECGINEKGLCVGTSSGHPQKSRADGEGIPQHMIPRLILRYCANVQEAIAFCAGHDTFGKGLNIVVVDRQGEAAALEQTFTVHGVRRPANGVVFSTNHYWAPETQVFGAQADPDYIMTPYFQNSLNRAANLTRRFGSPEVTLTLAELKSALMDHHNPGAVCQHPDNNEAGWQTYFGAYVVAQRGEMWINEGFPCRDRFERYSLIG